MTSTSNILMYIQIPLTLLPSLLFLVFCFIPAFTVLWIFKRQTAKKKSPLNIDLLRSPGESIRIQVDDETSEILVYLFCIPAVTVLTYAVGLTHYISLGNKMNLLVMIIYLAIIVGCTVYFIMKVLTFMKRRNQLRLGYDCELAVGQELNTRMRDGFHVFHDFPADGFNIDHVLVGSTGVFAIETKGRAKLRVTEKDNWKVQFDGKQLIFPDWTETKPIEQAMRQAKWLSSWLQKSTGTSCKANPVLAIPGWYIITKAPSELKVYNGKNSSFLAKGQTLLSPQQIQAISHQIDQKVRTVTSSSYRQETDNQ